MKCQRVQQNKAITTADSVVVKAWIRLIHLHGRVPSGNGSEVVSETDPNISHFMINLVNR